jgi:hypothetical protein
LLPNKPGLVNVCPQCSDPQEEIEVIGRKPRHKRQKTANELIADAERKLRNTTRMRDLIYAKTGKDKSSSDAKK